MDLVKIRLDDYEALYIDGDLIDQEHSGTIETFIYGAKKPVTISSFVIESFDDDSSVADQVYNEGFPQKLSDLKR